MSDIKAEVLSINNILEHPNADRMELAMVDGYQVCVQKDLYKVNDLVIYIPVDSVLTEKLESLIFGPDSKVKLHKHRVRAIKLRGAVSQGMIVPLELVKNYFGMPFRGKICDGIDVTEALGITKYQPPIKSMPQSMQARPKRHCHPDFHKYTDMNHFKKYTSAIPEGHPIIVSEKLHGTNFRCGWVKSRPRTLFQKLKRIMRISPEWEFVYGSHNVQLQDGKGKDAFANNVYARIVMEHGLKDKIPYGEVWYGEIIGPDIQKGYGYSIPQGEYDVYFFDIMWGHTGKYVSFDQMVRTVERYGEKAVPYSLGNFNLAHVMDLAQCDGPSYVDGKTVPIEGYVIRPQEESSFYGGRLILKLLTDDYLLIKDSTDWH